jgi:hypothetical protein
VREACCVWTTAEERGLSKTDTELVRVSTNAHFGMVGVFGKYEHTDCKCEGWALK